MSAIPEARRDILGLRSYKPGAQVDDTIRLNANEAPTGRGNTALNRYPEVRPFALRDRLSSFLGVDPRNLLVTRGSSESIDVLVRAWCQAYQDEILVTPPTFDMYRVYADIQGVKVREVPLLEPEFEVDTSRVLETSASNTKLIFICSPNNPTGTLTPVEDILNIARSRAGQSLLVVDEAYIEFSGRESLAGTISEYPNLVILRTLSKAHALAGARCGVTIADPGVIDVLGKVLPPYSFPTPVIERVSDALSLSETKQSAAAVQEIVSERQALESRLDSLDCVVRTWPSSANFILTRFKNLREVVTRLEQHRVLIRDFGDLPALENCARITVGTPRENETLLTALSGIGSRDDG